MKRNWLQCTGPEWDRQRVFAMARDHCECQAHKLGLADIEGVCTQATPENRPRKLQVHHLKERFFGGTHDLDNLITICRKHHEMIHPHMRYLHDFPDKTLDSSPRELDWQLKEL